MEKCGPISDLIVRDWVVEDIRSKVLDVTDCIVNQGCKFWQGDDQSAEEIADCLINHLDVSQWTNDEFEYAVRVTNFYCALKFAYLNGLLQKDERGRLGVPAQWEIEGNVNGIQGNSC